MDLELQGGITIPRVRKGQKGDNADFYEMTASPAFFHVDKDGNISGAVKVRLWHVHGSARTEAKGESTRVIDNNGLALENQKFPIALDPSSNEDIKQNIDEEAVTAFTVFGIHNAPNIDIPILRDGKNGTNGKDGNSFSVKGRADHHVEKWSEVDGSTPSGIWLVDELASGDSDGKFIEGDEQARLYTGIPNDIEIVPIDVYTGDGYILNKDLWVWNGSSWQNLGEFTGPKGEDATTLYTSQDAITWNEEGSGDTASFPNVLVEVSVKVGDEVQPLDKEGLSASAFKSWKISATVQSGNYTIIKSDGNNVKNIILSNPQPESGTKDYWLNGMLRIKATQNGTGASITKDIPIALNALGTWKQTVIDDTMESVSKQVNQTFTDKGLTGTDYESRIKQNAEAIRTKVETTTYNQDKSSFTTRLSTIEQTATNISASVQEQGDILASFEMDKGGFNFVGNNYSLSNAKGVQLLYIDSSGNANFSGNVTATGGSIGGWNIKDGKLVSQATNNEGEPMAYLNGRDGTGRLRGVLQLSTATTGNYSDSNLFYLPKLSSGTKGISMGFEREDIGKVVRLYNPSSFGGGRYYVEANEFSIHIDDNGNSMTDAATGRLIDYYIEPQEVLEVTCYERTGSTAKDILGVWVMTNRMSFEDFKQYYFDGHKPVGRYPKLVAMGEFHLYNSNRQWSPSTEGYLYDGTALSSIVSGITISGHDVVVNFKANAFPSGYHVQATAVGRGWIALQEQTSSSMKFYIQDTTVFGINVMIYEPLWYYDTKNNS